MKNLHLLAALAALSLGVPSVAAVPGADAQKIVVRTAGIDLSTSKGAKTLDLRIMHAASALCGTASSSDMLGWKRVRQCREAARAATLDQRQAAFALAQKQREQAVASTR